MEHGDVEVGQTAAFALALSVLFKTHPRPSELRAAFDAAIAEYEIRHLDAMFAADLPPERTSVQAKEFRRVVQLLRQQLQ